MEKMLFLNWKTNPISCVRSVANSVNRLQEAAQSKTVFFPPAFYLTQLSSLGLSVGSSHVDRQPLGRDTGSLSLELLAQMTPKPWVMIGHGEVRQRGLTQQSCNQLLSRALDLNFAIVYCVGESLDQSFSSVLDQLKPLKDAKLNNVYIAYEPLWAIGSTQTPSLEQMVDKFEIIKDYFGNSAINLIYGGGLDEASFLSYWQSPFISGLLLGRMSQKVDTLVRLLECERV